MEDLSPDGVEMFRLKVIMGRPLSLITNAGGHPILDLVGSTVAKECR
jgi:hypothetical protein